MKKISIFASMIAIFAIASLTVNAQNPVETASATASATIIAPISITKTTDLNFGNVAVSNSDGTVIINSNDIRSNSGGVSLPVVTGTVSAAQFTVSGTADYAYTFTLPSSATTVTSGTNTMIVDNWTSNSTGIIVGGSEIVKVGATLNVTAGQATGTYVSGTPFAVTVNYN